MDDKTLEALKLSHEKWLANAKAETPDDAKTKSSDCPLCDLFRFRYSICSGCPIMERTGKFRCEGTPYEDAFLANMDWLLDKEAAAPQFRAAAQEMADFIGELIPKGGA